MYEFVPVRTNISYSSEMNITNIGNDMAIHFLAHASKVDPTKDVTFHFGFRCAATDGACHFHKYVSCIASNNTENHSWNVHSAVAYNIATTATRANILSVTIANASITAGDWIHIYMLYQETHDFYVSYGIVQYTHA